MASILPRRTKAGDVTWRVQFRIDGRMRQETFLDENGAAEFGRLVDTVGGAAARKVLELRRSKPEAVPTLRDWTARYLDEDAGLLTGIEPGTRSGYVKAAERSFLKMLGDYPVDAIEKADVGRWVAWQEKQPAAGRGGRPIAAKTVRNYHAILSASLAAAVEAGHRSDNPAHRTRLSVGTKREAVFLSPEEFATLLHFTPPRYQGFVLFLAGTGCRWGEATAVTWGDVNLTREPATVRIDKAWKKSTNGAPVLKHPKSSKSRRSVSLYPDLVHVLGEPQEAERLVFAGPLSGGHLWYNRFRDTTWDPAVTRAMNRELCAEAGLTPLTRRPTIHDLRHSHASWLIADGAPLPYIQSRLGHESITTTVGVYGHLIPEAHTQMSASIAKTLNGVRPLRQVPALPELAHGPVRSSDADGGQQS